MSSAQGVDYTTIAEPLEGGDFRMAVVLDDDAPHQLSYEFELPVGVTPHEAPDGGYLFVDDAGRMVGGLAAPWALDANGQRVPVTYSFHGTTLTRTVMTNAETAFPVVTNWCLFGKNPNGSCRGSSVAKRVAYDAAWFIGGAAVCGPIGAATAGAAAVVCAGAVYGARVATESAARRHP